MKASVTRFIIQWTRDFISGRPGFLAHDIRKSIIILGVVSQ